MLLSERKSMHFTDVAKLFSSTGLAKQKKNSACWSRHTAKNTQDDTWDYKESLQITYSQQTNSKEPTCPPVQQKKTNTFHAFQEHCEHTNRNSRARPGVRGDAVRIECVRMFHARWMTGTKDFWPGRGKGRTCVKPCIGLSEREHLNNNNSSSSSTKIPPGITVFHRCARYQCNLK